MVDALHNIQPVMLLIATGKHCATSATSLQEKQRPVAMLPCSSFAVYLPRTGAERLGFLDLAAGTWVPSKCELADHLLGPLFIHGVSTGIWGQTFASLKHHWIKFQGFMKVFVSRSWGKRFVPTVVQKKYKPHETLWTFLACRQNIRQRASRFGSLIFRQDVQEPSLSAAKTKAYPAGLMH